MQLSDSCILHICFKYILETTDLSYLFIKYAHHVINWKNHSLLPNQIAKSDFLSDKDFLKVFQFYSNTYLWQAIPLLNSHPKVERKGAREKTKAWDCLQCDTEWIRLYLHHFLPYLLCLVLTGFCFRGDTFSNYGFSDLKVFWTCDNALG